MGGYLALLGIVPALARCAVLVRIRSSHLIDHYRWFAAYVVAGLLQEGAWFLGDPRSVGYASWWTHTAPFVIATSIGATVELWNLTMSRYRGVSRIYSWLVPAVITIIAVGTLLTAVDFWAIEWRPTIYRVFLLTYRYTEAPLAMGCAFSLVWALVFPEQAPKNVKIHAIVLTGNLTAVAAGNGAIVLAHGYNVVAGPAMAVISVSFFAVWAIFMTREGEISEPPRPLEDDEAARVRARERDLLNVRRYLRFRP